ncbi:hypothetical protein [Citrobacter sp. Cu233]|uniref:hypothetical protein n=1 Tax=Citrobacter sp. Cu233 TaxID=2985160 RepID=UPI00257575C3|nr:hypothetical protein [Citrobacter sp. Cu233]MDM2935261.1 hypothetical protein [Citrobacter sp. Cu233]
MKINRVVLVSVVMLTGCVVADMDSSNYDYVPWVQVFQKPEASGLTNVAQRKVDLYACGVNPKANLDGANWSLNGIEPGETFESFNTRRDHILSCMEEKGYKVYGFAACGPKKAPTGLCPN